MKNVLIAAFMAFVAIPFAAQAQKIAGPTKPQTAAVDYFLKIEGVDGESDGKDCRKCWIEIESVAWGTPTPSPARAGGGGGGAGKVSVHDISMIPSTDHSTPKLQEAVATGKHFKKAVLFVRKAGKEQHEYLTYELENVLISSFSAQNNAGDPVPTESFSLNFTKITYSWTDASGKTKNLGAGQTPESVLRKFAGK
ncbi:MAG: type VI secretion system tube protein Hcp [Lewinellaceae bacterium]|nr:type VI secretion system tube protein Hcp [Lewinellaceae bacterium]